MWKKITGLLDTLYGVGIYICLFVGGAMALAYLAAFFVGGETAAAICDFVYNKIYKVLIYGGNVIIVLGLVSMYIRHQKTLTIDDLSESDS